MHGEKRILPTEADDKLVLSHFRDLISAVKRYEQCQFTHFLSPRGIGLINDNIHTEPGLSISKFGGFQSSERCMMAIYPDYLNEDEVEFPIACVLLTGKDISSLQHRDFLGAVIALGIKREVVGDIVILSDGVVIYCHKKICTFITENLIKVGNVGVKAQLKPLDDITIPKQSFKELSGTVASLRLDAVLGLCIKKSRTQAAELIQAKRVMLNYKEQTSLSATIKEGDIISARGFGKMAVRKIGPLTKKGRTSIVIDIYN